VRRLILVGVYLDRPSETAWIERAVPGARLTLVRLMAGDPTLDDRVRHRELGTGLDDQLERTARQRAAMEDDVRPGVRILATDAMDVVATASTIIGLWPRTT
jgi:hypothetical protein